MPSVVFSVLSWMFTPSSVIAIELCGRPLIVEFRTELAVCTPGRNCAKSRALRLPTGRLVIDLVLIVVDEAADCVCTISVAPVTTTVSVTPPTSSVARTVPGTPAVTMTPFSTAVLNPGARP